MSETDGNRSNETTIARALAPVLDAQVEVINLYKAVLKVNVPRADSLGMAEIANEKEFISDEWPNPVQQAHAFAGLIAFAAVDHYDALTTLLGREEVPYFSCNVVARAALDAAGTANWLAESVGTERRVKRGAIALAQAGKDMKRAPADAGTTRQQGAAIVGTVERGAAKLGWTSSIADRARIEVGGENLPTPKEAIGAAIDAEDHPVPAAPALWWHLSGYTGSSDLSGVDGVDEVPVGSAGVEQDA